MVPIQPTNIFSYLRRQPMQVPSTLQRYFYVSWEDALWDIIKSQDIPRGSRVLIPEFFCMDVVENMQQHGLEAIWYPMDSDFQTDSAVFCDLLKKNQPQIIIIFHAVGITNRLFAQATIWLPFVPENVVLIEDSVHRVVNPERIHLLAPKHVIIDSLRKVVPLPGSNVYCDPHFKLQQTPMQKTVLYQLHVLIWWGIFQCCLTAVRLFPFYKWQNLWNSVAEKAMLHGYDVIGDSVLAGKGWIWAKWVSLHLDWQKIYECKQKQVAQYQKNLRELNQCVGVFLIKFPQRDSGVLRGFPLGISLPHAQKILEQLRKKGLFLRFELQDCPWSNRQKVLYLPLGPHLSIIDIDDIALQVKTVILEVSRG